jgi:hypothetical protein
VPEGARPSLRPRTRQPDRYGALLSLILIDCVVIFTSTEKGTSRWLPAVMVAITVLVGLETSQVGGWWVNSTRVLAGLLIVASAIDAFVGTDLSLAWIAVAQAVLLGILVVAIIGRLFTHSRVTAQTVLAVLCIYVVFGLIFALFAYGISGITGNQFFVQNPDPTLADFVYFSFVVLTTLGFGDLTPANNSGKAMVSFEALLGQIFLVTVVSRLVSLYTKASPPQGSEVPPEGPPETSGAQPGE